MTNNEAKAIHKRMYRDVEAIAETIEEIDQTLFEIFSAIVLPITSCINPADVMRELRANKKRIQSKALKLKVIAQSNGIHQKSLKWEYKIDKELTIK